MQKSPEKKQKKSENKKNPCAEFTFDARSKPLVDGVIKIEAQLLKKPFAKKPKIGIQTIEASLKNRKDIFQLNTEIFEVLGFYRQHKDLSNICNALGRLTLESASEETENTNRQFSLLYLAVDLFSMANQYTEKGLSLNAISLLYSTFKILGAQAWDGFTAITTVRDIIKKMYTKTKSLNDPQSRELIFQTLFRGRRYYDSLIELGEYENILKVNSRALWQKKKGMINYNRALVLQRILDFFFNYIWGHAKEQETLLDVGKLRAFIYRFNQDNKIKLTPVKDKSSLALMKTMESFITLSNYYCQEAIKDEQFVYKHNAYFMIAVNNFRVERHKASWANILHSIELLDKSRLSSEIRKKEKLKIKNFQLQIAEKMNMNKNIQDIKDEIQQISKQEEEKEKEEEEL